MRACSRRELLKMGTGLLAGCLVPAAGWSALLPDGSRRSLSVYNTHTGERLNVCYYQQGAYCADALERINHILRDHRTGDIQAIDRRLIDLMHSVNQRLVPGAPFHIISGYRSPTTNARLRKQSRGVAKFSFHMLGRAIDVRLPGCSTHELRKACQDMHVGGVGYYPKSDFVHVDTGTVRNWQG